MNPKNTHILLCTLGVTWAVIPEAYALLAPEKLPLYQAHPQQAGIQQLREDYQLTAPDEIWVCTTQGVRTTEGIGQLRAWLGCLDQPPRLRIWQAQGTDELASHEECRHMRELIFRASLHASQRVGGGQLVLSLAGGRKTMSADLQEAGALFGCHALLHVIGKENLPNELRTPNPATLAQPLSAELCHFVLPLAIGSGQRNDVLDVAFEGVGPVTVDRFPLAFADDLRPEAWPAPTEWLAEEIARRQKAGSRLLGNFLQSLGRSEHHENWRSLYRLPPAKITELRETALEERHRDWLIQLPKADLHRHVGGCLDLPAQITVGRAVWDSLKPSERDAALKRVSHLLESSSDWPWNWPHDIQYPPALRPHAIAALLTQCDPTRLERMLYGVTESRFALKARNPHGFAAYERPGELTGSAILSHPAAIEPYARAIVDQAIAEGLAYVELRGSPQKYGEGLNFLQQFRAALQREVAARTEAIRPLFRFIVIANRRDEAATIGQVVKLAVQGKERLDDFVVGLDVAGDEGESSDNSNEFDDLAQMFKPAFAACLPITIHAGEGESAENIWHAAYRLHADRIGHGLSLSDHPNLARRFRDRGIGLELCPTSNREVVGYFDPALPYILTKDTGRYPLHQLWQAGIPLTLCTDNPGISRTTLANEYLTAARMVEGSLSLWDVLAMIKQAFTHAFLPSDTKEEVMKRVDAEIYRLLT